jgi:hypothetical protein
MHMNFFVKFHENYANMPVILNDGESVMPISIKATTNTHTGIRGVQRYGEMYRWRVDAVRFRSLTGQDPTPSFIARLNERESGCVDSASFHTIEDAGDDLCQFLKAMTGVSFEY